MSTETITFQSRYDQLRKDAYALIGEYIMQQGKDGEFIFPADKDYIGECTIIEDSEMTDNDELRVISVQIDSYGNIKIVTADSQEFATESMPDYDHYMFDYLRAENVFIIADYLQRLT